MGCRQSTAACDCDGGVAGMSNADFNPFDHQPDQFAALEGQREFVPFIVSNRDGSGDADPIADPDTAPPRESNVRLVAFDRGHDQRIEVMQRLTGGMIGLGATPQPSGVAFRWAPVDEVQPDAMFVVGSFNDWNPTSNPMQRDRDGTWFGWIENASPGDAYRYRKENGGRATQFIDPRAQHVCSSGGCAIVVDRRYRWNTSHVRPASLSQLVIVELDHRSGLCQKNTEGRAPLDEISRTLSRHAGLGANAICLTPQSSCPAVPFAIEKVDGGPESFKRLVDRAHELSLAVFVTVKTPNVGKAVQRTASDPSEQPRSRPQPIWTSGDLIEASRRVRDQSLMWFDEYHVDGICLSIQETLRAIHLDGGNHLGTRRDFFSWFNREIKNKHPDAITIATEASGDGFVTKPDVEGGKGFSCQIDESASQRSGFTTDVTVIKDAINHGYNNDVFERVIRSPLAIQHPNWLALMMTAPGVPMLAERIDARLTDDRLTDLLRRLARLRVGDEKTKGLRGQIVDVFHCRPETKIIAMRRSESGGPGDDVVIVMNFSNTARRGYSIGMPDVGTWKVRLSNDRRYATEIVATDDRRDHQIASANLDVPAGGFVILSKDG